MSERIAVEVAPDQQVTATLYPAPKGKQAGITLILGHGAGTNQTHDFMVHFATSLAARGIDTVTFNFVYTELGKRLPDKNDKLESCWRAVIAAVRDGKMDTGTSAGSGVPTGRPVIRFHTCTVPPSSLSS